jgi:hypothetical protein
MLKTKKYFKIYKILSIYTTVKYTFILKEGKNTKLHVYSIKFINKHLLTKIL